MKKITLLTCITIILMTTACKEKTETVYSDCLEEKIEAFKSDEGAQRIVKITRPDGILYWFEDSYGDGIEDVINEACEVVCITDCECTGNFVFCDSTHFNFPQETIWER